MVDELGPLEKELLIQINKQGLNESDIANVIKNLKYVNPKKYKTVPIDFNNKHLRYGYISDAHMGSSYYRSDVMDSAAKYFNKVKVEFINSENIERNSRGKFRWIYSEISKNQIENGE